MTANAEIQTTSDDQATAVVSQRRLSEPATAESARKTSVSCSHCGLPVPRGLIQLSQQNQFCCNGCRVAYQIIHENGLTPIIRWSTSRQANRLSKIAKGHLPKEIIASLMSQHFFRGLLKRINEVLHQLPLWLKESTAPLVFG